MANVQLQPSDAAYVIRTRTAHAHTHTPKYEYSYSTKVATRRFLSFFHLFHSDCHLDSIVKMSAAHSKKKERIARADDRHTEGDITIISSDCVSFKIHIYYLQAHRSVCLPFSHESIQTALI